MPAILICQKPDGRILVAAMPEEAVGQYEQDAVEAASLEEAATMVTDVLGGAPAEGGEAPSSEMGETTDAGETPTPQGAQPQPEEEEDDPMQRGFDRARAGY
jgi:hypothetical protein